jgi:hypothetical protein
VSSLGNEWKGTLSIGNSTGDGEKTKRNPKMANRCTAGMVVMYLHKQFAETVALIGIKRRLDKMKVIFIEPVI